MKSLLLGLPLAIIIFVAVLNICGVGESLGGVFGGALADSTSSYADLPDFHDSYNHYVAFGNGTAYGEAGTIGTYNVTFPVPETRWKWTNETATYTVSRDSEASGGVGTHLFGITGSLGMIGIVVAVMALSLVVGIRVLGSGVSVFSVGFVIIGTALITVWGVFSLLAYSLIGEIPNIGGLIYFGLTGMYTLGSIFAAGGVGGED